MEPLLVLLAVNIADIQVLDVAPIKWIKGVTVVEWFDPSHHIDAEPPRRGVDVSATEFVLELVHAWSRGGASTTAEAFTAIFVLDKIVDKMTK